MAGLNNVEIDKSSWFKWPYAVAVGAPLAIGIGYWYLLRKSKSDPPSKINNDISDIKATNSTSQVCSSTNTSPGVEINSSVTQVEPVKPPVKEETPLERAIALKASGNTFFKSKKYEDAIRCYSEAIDICPENEKSHLATFYQNRAAAHEHMQNFEGSKKDCSAALDLDPKYLKALQRRAKAYEHLGDLTSCLEDITAVCILEMFKNEHSLLTADRILQQIGKNYAKEAIKNRKTVLLSKHFVKAYFISFNNDPVVNFKNEVNGHSTEENDITGLEKAKKFLLNGDYENVIEICNEELEKDDKLWEVLLLRATMLFLVGEQKLALADFDKIISGDCPNVAIKANALIKRASLYLQIETPEMSIADRINMPIKNELFMPEKCMKDFSAAEELDPNNSDIYHHRGQVYLLMDKMDVALEDFKKALKRNPDSPVVKVQMHYAQYRLASNIRDLDTISNTIDAFKDVMKNHPDCIEAYSLFIQICTDQQNCEQADEYFKKAIKADPTNATVRVQRATLYLQWKGDIDKAIELIEEAIKIDDRCEYGYETLGTIEVQRGNLTRAVELFEKALQFAKGERELAHIYSLKNAAMAQAVVAERLGFPTAFRPS